jgi:hypothetical protein
MKRSLDTALVMEAWDELAPTPEIDLAERVLARLDRPVRAQRRWPLVAAALAVAGLLAPLLVSPRTPQRTVIAQSADADLGLQTD